MGHFLTSASFFSSRDSPGHLRTGYRVYCFPCCALSCDMLGGQAGVGSKKQLYSWPVKQRQCNLKGCVYVSKCKALNRDGLFVSTLDSQCMVLVWIVLYKNTLEGLEKYRRCRPQTYSKFFSELV